MSTFVIVGGSYAAVQAAVSARQHGYDGRIVLLSAEKELPYHRPPLSKSFLNTEMPSSRLWLRSEAFYEQHQIDVELGQTVTQLDLGKQQVEFGQSCLTYDNLLLATGARAMTLPWQITPVKGVFSLRDLADAQAIKEHLPKAKKAVVIGGGFIGLELASSLSTLGIDTTVVELSERLAGRVVSPFISEYLLQRHQQQGVRVCLNSQVAGVKHDQQVTAVVLADGQEIEADLVVVGVGAKPNTELLAPFFSENVAQGIQVNTEAKTVIPAVWAAGDCALTSLNLGAQSTWLRLESVNAANELGKAAGAAIAGKSEPFVTAPWFWSDQFDLKIQMVGIALPTDTLVLRGEPESKRFSVFHLRQTGEIGAVQSINRPAEHLLARRLVSERQHIATAILQDESINLKEVTA